MPDQDIDPRYDPQFQRGFSGGAADARRATAPDRTDAPAPRLPRVTGRGGRDADAASGAASGAAGEAAFGTATGPGSAGGIAARSTPAGGPAAGTAPAGSAASLDYVPAVPGSSGSLSGAASTAIPADDSLRAHAEAAVRGTEPPRGPERAEPAGAVGATARPERRDIRRNPFLWAVLVAGLLLVLIGAGLYRDLGEQLSDTGTRTADNYLQVQFELGVAPLALALGIAAILAVGLVHAREWQRR